jgi:hypothetical protein
VRWAAVSHGVNSRATLSAELQHTACLRSVYSGVHIKSSAQAERVVAVPLQPHQGRLQWEIGGNRLKCVGCNTTSTLLLTIAARYGRMLT